MMNFRWILVILALSSKEDIVKFKVLFLKLSVLAIYFGTCVLPSKCLISVCVCVCVHVCVCACVCVYVLCSFNDHQRLTFLFILFYFIYLFIYFFSEVKKLIQRKSQNSFSSLNILSYHFDFAAEL